MVKFYGNSKNRSSIPTILTVEEKEKLKDNRFYKMFPYPQWTEKEEMLVRWFLNYVAQRTVTQKVYLPLIQEIEKGPRGPLAISKELQTKLNQAHYLVEGYFLNLDE